MSLFSRSARFLSLATRRFLAFSSSLTIRRLSPFSRFGLEDRVFELLDLLVDEAVEELVGDRQELERTVRDDDGVIIAGRDARHGPLAVAGGEMVLAGDEELGLRIKLQERRAPLLDQMIGHDEHRLFREAQAAHFHRGGRHRPGLARADDMRQQRAAALQDAPDRVFLVAGRSSVAQKFARFMPGKVRCEPSKVRRRRLLKRSL